MVPNNLLEDYPEIASEWDYEKNGELSPENITKGCNTKIWWICPNGHSYESTPNRRTNLKSGCPYCTNRKVLPGYNDLLSCFPDVAAEWDYEMNKDIGPDQVLPGSQKKCWWKCSSGHKYECKVFEKTSKRSKCPYCSNRKVLSGYNDLETLNPELAKEWNYDKNNGLTPNKVRPFSQKKVWWKCSKGHEWQSMVSNRSHGSGCPYCPRKTKTKSHKKSTRAQRGTLAKNHPELLEEWDYSKNTIDPTLVNEGSEKKAWWICRRCKHNWQVAIKNRTCGAKCPVCAGKVVKAGINDLETTNPELLVRWDYSKNTTVNPNSVMSGNTTTKVWWKCPKGHSYQRVPYLEMISKDCPVCSGRTVLLGYNDLLSINPQLAKEWNYEKNKDLSPSEISRNSSKKVWWKCSKGHEWQAAVRIRDKGIGCPYCANRKCLSGYNDIATTHPELALEWDSKLNQETPEEVTVGSSKKVWWKCAKCGYSWFVSPVSRIRRRGHISGCPACTNHVAYTGLNDFGTLYPEAAQNWDFEKNGSLLPTMVLPNSTKKVWWKCPKGHEYYRAILYATRGNRCPECANRNHHR